MEKKEFDAEIEATEDQETVDPETGITLSGIFYFLNPGGKESR